MNEPRSEPGMVTVELAVSFAGIVVVLAMVLGAISTVRVQSQLCQAVREGARAEALGSSGEAAAAVAFGRELSVSASRQGRWALVDGQAPAATVGRLSIGTVNCRAQVLLEQGVTGED